ncbi:hypothetical protein CJ672_09700 [Arcobacter cryaerophilus gv. occultus]|uniref:hypothetical protein n=1 Tax=Aliarcobacter cryaerophilus TaxID=28198 RepID=UPI000D011D30|nr:hypothetical protein [Aliarcobacter cryaerophilus]PRM91349.1 hypothetical protein CJ672_09700 [Arcobacter cryaerophilus gv. occultus]
MIIGNGQLANIFYDYNRDDVLIFASGVSDSNCIDETNFEREKKLLIDTLKKNQNSKFVYFSSSALSSDKYPKNEYYKHKMNMEEIVKKFSKNYYIFRIPQLFGDLIVHKTLINFIYRSIINEEKFNIYDQAYRYVIEINDVRKLVELYLDNHFPCMIENLANPYRYKVLDIVKIFEKLLNKKAQYKIIEKEDKYILDLTSLKIFVNTFDTNVVFGEEYLSEKLKEKLHRIKN